MFIRNARDGGVVGLLSKGVKKTANVYSHRCGRDRSSATASLNVDGVAL